MFEGSVALAFHCLPDVELETRAAAAEGAGFGSIGLSARRLKPLLNSGVTLPDLVAMLSSHNLTVSEVEALRPFGVEPDPDEVFIYRVAAGTGAPYVTTNAGLPSGATVAEMGGRLGAACDRAAIFGLRLLVEFLPWTSIPDVTGAASVVVAANRPNVGICLDVWHLYRSGQRLSDVNGYWPLIHGVQLSDGPLIAENPDLLADCLSNRRPLGEGAFDIAGLLQTVALLPSTVHVSLEVISDRLHALTPAAAAGVLRTGLEASWGKAQQ